jgi:flagellar hook-length control protein FliK
LQPILRGKLCPWEWFGRSMNAIELQLDLGQALQEPHARPGKPSDGLAFARELAAGARERTAARTAHDRADSNQKTPHPRHQPETSRSDHREHGCDDAVAQAAAAAVAVNNVAAAQPIAHSPIEAATGPWVMNSQDLGQAALPSAARQAPIDPLAPGIIRTPVPALPSAATVAAGPATAASSGTSDPDIAAAPSAQPTAIDMPGGWARFADAFAAARPPEPQPTVLAAGAASSSGEEFRARQAALATSLPLPAPAASETPSPPQPAAGLLAQAPSLVPATEPAQSVQQIEVQFDTFRLRRATEQAPQIAADPHADLAAIGGSAVARLVRAAVANDPGQSDRRPNLPLASAEEVVPQPLYPQSRPATSLLADPTAVSAHSKPDAAGSSTAAPTSAPVVDGSTSMKGNEASPETILLAGFEARNASRATGAAVSGERIPFVPLAEQVAVHVRAALAQGDDRIVVQLHPASLGRVEIELQVKPDGHASLVILADRQGTLDLLQRDSAALERALNDAGLKTESGSLDFNLRGNAHGEGRQAHGFAAGAERRASLPGRTSDDKLPVLPPPYGARAVNGRIDIRV